MPGRVHILLSTYNGEEFLAELLQSLRSQTLPPAFITIRDDGSSDCTYERDCEFAAHGSNVEVVRGQNLGAACSFLDLLARAESDCDCFAFADQDDVWMPDKLARAVSQLDRVDSSKPAMYCARQEYVDRNLNHLGFSALPRRVGFGNALVENIATGCTVVLNREARKIILKRRPSSLLMHDWWFYMVTSALGTVIYDETPSVKYRLHGQNAIGAPTGRGQKLRRGLTRFLRYTRGTMMITDQALGFKKCFGDILETHDSRLLERFLSTRRNFWSRMKYSARMDVWRQSRFDNLILRLMILVGRI